MKSLREHDHPHFSSPFCPVFFLSLSLPPVTVSFVLPSVFFLSYVLFIFPSLTLYCSFLLFFFSPFLLVSLSSVLYFSFSHTTFSSLFLPCYISTFIVFTQFFIHLPFLSNLISLFFILFLFNYRLFIFLFILSSISFSSFSFLSFSSNLSPIHSI